jgi:hypothetical protein
MKGRRKGREESEDPRNSINKLGFLCKTTISFGYGCFFDYKKVKASQCTQTLYFTRRVVFFIWTSKVFLLI